MSGVEKFGAWEAVPGAGCHGHEALRGPALQRTAFMLGGWLATCVTSIAAATTASPRLPLPLPPPGAPASAYGPGVRSGAGQPNADDLAGLAARLRERGYLSQALQLSQRVLDYAPDNRQAIQTVVSTLSNMGGTDLAYRMAMKHAALFSAEDLQRLRADRAAVDVRAAIGESRRLEKHALYSVRKVPLEAALRELDANLALFPHDSEAYRRTVYDRLYLLREMGHMQEVIRAYRALQPSRVPVPTYVKQAAAEAYEQRNQPKPAAALYREIISANPKADVEIFIGLYYALVDSEDYAAAASLLSRIEHDTPVSLGGDPHVPRQPNWERLDVDQLGVLDAAYRNHDATAERRARDLYDAAPHSAELTNVYASILRRRGWPRRSQRVTELAATYEPYARATRINLAENARELGQYDRWHALLAPLAREFPDDSTIVRNLKEWEGRHRVSVSAELMVGHSGTSNALNGNRDRHLQLRLSSPWSTRGWRVYGLQEYSWSAYGEGNASSNRVGAGAEWRWARKHAWVALGDDRFTGRHAGMQAGWSQWLDDRWHYQVSADSYSLDTPMRALRAGLRGRSLQAQVTWRASESRSATLAASGLDISDGNRRTSLSAAFTQRIQASAHHQTRLSFRLDDMRDSREGGAYFNPADLRSAGVTLSHDWITWRRYEQSFTQAVEVTLGDEWQSTYGSAAGVDLQYVQSWQCSRTWAVHYGFGWGSHVYDGAREHRVYGVFGFSGVF